jgi:hypothetical protein
MIKDTMHSEYLGVPLTENWECDDEEFFLDGPVTRRVAVLDFDPATGELSPAVRFLAPGKGKKIGRYSGPAKPADRVAVMDPKFIRVCALSAVLRTMKMFEDSDALGRKLTWAFEHPQLLVVPRAGEWANAFYERESRSLQFFSFPSAEKPDETIYTCLSNDIVAHETGHAILDGIAPDLYHALTPQALALHEAVADLVAVVMAFRSRTLREAVLNKTGGTIQNSNAFAGMAEQFQLANSPFGDKHYLRNLNNPLTLADLTPAQRTEPHALSEVLSGALYRLVIDMHAARVKQFSNGTPESNFSVSGKALGVAADHFKRMIFRALDYLPPGEVSFADYGRAIVAADQASHPDDANERNALTKEFVRRGIVPDESALHVQTNYDEPAVAALDLATLVESDWAAYEFANMNRALLGIPDRIHFWVRPRLDTTKTYYRRGASGKSEQVSIRECIFKVSWDHQEPSNAGAALPKFRQITVGTTLAIAGRPAKSERN